MRKHLGFVVALVTMALFQGCGESRAPGASGGGGATPATAIAGTWVYDGATALAAPTDAAGKALEQATQAMPKMDIEYVFAADGTFTLEERVGSDKRSTLTGTWEYRDGKYFVTEKTKNGQPRSRTDAMNTVEMELKEGDLFFAPRGSPVAFHLRRK